MLKKILLAVALVLALGRPAQAALAYSLQTSNYTSGTTTLPISITAGTGANRIMVVFIYNVGGNTISSVAFDGYSFTQFNVDGSFQIWGHYFGSTASGYLGNLTITASVSQKMSANILEYSGGDINVGRQSNYYSSGTATTQQVSATAKYSGDFILGMAAVNTSNTNTLGVGNNETLL